jgi:Mn-dependent DtxR family transcriptional regulator
MEHAISPEVEALLMKRFAGHKTCPHGVPLRGGFAQLRNEGAVLLSELQLHDSAEIVSTKRKKVSSIFSRTFIFALPQKSKS